MLSEKEILEKIEHYQKKSDEYLSSSKNLEYGSPSRNLAWTSHCSYAAMVFAMKEILEIEK